MGCDAGFVRDKGIAGDPAQAACPGPILSGPDKVPPDPRATQIRIDIPPIDIGNGAGSAALGMVAKAHPGEARQPCPGPAGNRDDGVPGGGARQAGISWAASMSSGHRAPFRRPSSPASDKAAGRILR